MATIVSRGKPMSVNPLKVSQPMGASLALLGIARAIPMEHGAQGCTAFSKVFFTRHFREPIPLQTTAINHSLTVMGADGNIVEGLHTIAERHAPSLIGVVTTGLTETQGVDIRGAVKQFRQHHPQHARCKVVPVHAPDTLGCLESGFAAAVEAMIHELVPESTHGGRYPWQVNVLAGSLLTPGDVEALKAWIGAFGLCPIVLPDLADALDGHLDAAGYSELSQGGTSVDEIALLGKSVATLVIGRSMHRAADLLRARTGVPDHRFDSLMGLDDCDAFSAVLATLSRGPGPERIERERAQLMDAMVDCHFALSGARIALAADPDLLGGLSRFLVSLGAEVCAVVASARADSLEELALPEVVVGDLEDFERAAAAEAAQLVIANSHAVPAARRLGLPILRAGFPIHDHAGAHARQWIGYRGSRQALFDLANLLAEARSRILPYRSIYWQDGPRDGEAATRVVPADTAL